MRLAGGHPVPREAEDVAGSISKGRPPNTFMPPPPRASVPETPPRLRDGVPEQTVILVDRINAGPASLDPVAYAGVSSGRDFWTGANRDDITALAKSAVTDREDLFVALTSLNDTQRMFASRWICRGLDPEHALCMTVVREAAYERDISRIAMETATAIAQKHAEPEQVPEI